MTSTARLLGVLRRHPRPRGFTLVETIVASALAAIAVLAILAVIVQLTSQSASALTRAELARQVTQLDSQLNRDIATAMPCQAHRAGSIVRTYTPNRIAWTVDPDGDGTAELVTWALSGGQLLRSTVPDRGNCTFITEGSTGAAVQIVLDGLTPDGPQPTSATPGLPSFGLYLVAPDTDPASTVDGVDELVVHEGGDHDAVGVVVTDHDCTDEPFGCLPISGLRLSVDATTAENTRLSVDRTVTFPSDRSRLTTFAD